MSPIRMAVDLEVSIQQQGYRRLRNVGGRGEAPGGPLPQEVDITVDYKVYLRLAKRNANVEVEEGEGHGSGSSVCSRCQLQPLRQCHRGGRGGAPGRSERQGR